MSLRSPADNENGNPYRCIRFRPLSPRRGKIEMGVLKRDLRSPLPCLPRQGEGINSALSLSFAPRLSPTIFEGAHEGHEGFVNKYDFLTSGTSCLRGKSFFAYSSCAMTYAKPCSLVWVIDRAQRRIPSSLASLAVLSCKVMSGLPLRARTTSISSQRTFAPQPLPSAFITASLAANRPA